jgi:hypothetical protein
MSCLTATAAHAQQLSASDFARAATKTGNGWWSPERNASTLVAPYLQLTMSKKSRFAFSEMVRNSTTEQSNYFLSEETARPTANHDGLGLKLATQNPEVSPLVEGELLSTRSFISILAARYVMWESSLAATRSLMNVNGTSVYPLVQINYDQWQLPIGLYAPPLRGSDAR